MNAYVASVERIKTLEEEASQTPVKFVPEYKMESEENLVQELAEMDQDRSRILIKLDEWKMSYDAEFEAAEVWEQYYQEEESYAVSQSAEIEQLAAELQEQQKVLESGSAHSKGSTQLAQALGSFRTELDSARREIDVLKATSDSKDKRVEELRNHVVSMNVKKW